MSLHRFVGVHGVQAWCVKAGKPHIPNNHDAEGVLGIFEPVCQIAPPFLVPNVRLPLWAILRAAGHDDFDYADFAILRVAIVILGTFSIRAQFDDGVV